MEEESTQKANYDLEYKFVNDQYKKDYILARIAEAERAHFELMVDRLDEGHSEYHDWADAVEAVMSEIDRLKYIYRQLGGSFGSEFINNDG
tara:strand:+ start:6776 stop:7048 length:273 start_codon:yes stop_codon:yes gene_type:complete